MRLEALRVRTRVVHFDHTRADIDAYELCDVRREGAGDLTYNIYIMLYALAEMFFQEGKEWRAGEDEGPDLSRKRSLGLRWCPRRGRGRARDGAQRRAGPQIRPRPGGACQSRGRGHRNGLGWPLRAAAAARSSWLWPKVMMVVVMMKGRGGGGGDDVDDVDDDDDGTTLAALPLLLLLLLLLGGFAFAAVVAVVPWWVAVLVVSGVPGLAWSVAATPLRWPSVYKEV